MNQNMSRETGSTSSIKKTITVVIVILVALAFGYYLFKISPQQSNGTVSGYNASLSTAGAKKLDAIPPFDPATDHYQGNKDAKNVFIEYGDLQCPACAAYSEILKGVPNEFSDTVFVFRYFPLVNIHQNSVEAALAAEAANAQGKYWEMHDILFQKQVDWQAMGDPLDTFAKYAQEVGVSNIEQFKTDITSKKYLSKVESDNNQAIGLDLQGTPALTFNGHTLNTGGNLTDLKKQSEPFFNK